MTWARLDDGFWMHPNVIVTGNTAAGIFARMLSYCGCYLTDGLVPESIANTIVGKDTRALAALIDRQLVERLETGSYYISDYLDYNPPKDEVEKLQRQRREAGRKGGQAKATANGRQELHHAP